MRPDQTGPVDTPAALATLPAPVAVAEPRFNRQPAPIEWVGVFGFFTLVGLLSVHVIVAPGASWGLLFGMSLLGYLGADLFSGLVHWAFDTWGATDTPILGPAFIHHFRMHHVDAKDITRHGFVATNGNNCLVTVPVLLWAMMLPDASSWTGPLRVMMLALCLGVFGTNQFHKWAHSDTVSPFVAWLQKVHLILPVDHHDVHHTFPYIGHYCITTGWLNGPLDKIGFFRGAERLISAVTGAVPRESDLADAKAHSQAV